MATAQTTAPVAVKQTPQAKLAEQLQNLTKRAVLDPKFSQADRKALAENLKRLAAVVETFDAAFSAK